MATVPNGEQTLPKILTGWVGRTNVTDDRQTTYGRAIAYSEREHEFTFANNMNYCIIIIIIIITVLQYEYLQLFTTSVFYRCMLINVLLYVNSPVWLSVPSSSARFTHTVACGDCIAGLCLGGVRTFLDVLGLATNEAEQQMGKCKKNSRSNKIATKDYEKNQLTKYNKAKRPYTANKDCREPNTC